MGKRIRVLHLLTDANIGGAGVMLAHIINGYNRSRYEMTVALPKGSRLRAYLPADCAIIDLPPTLHGLQKTVKDCACDIVHTHACAKGQIAAYRLGIPCVATRHCVNAPHPILRKGLMHLPPFVHTHWIAVSDAAADSLAKEGVQKSRISVVKNGIPPLATLPDSAAAKAALGIAENAFCVGYVGRLEHIKGADVFVTAAIAFLQQHPTAVAVVAGDGSLAKRLQHQIAKSGVDNRFHLLGFQKDTTRIFAACDIAVYPSRQEAYSLSLMEAMRQGVPTVASDVSGNAAMLAFGGGILVKADCARALQDGMEHLFCNPDLGKTLSEEAKTVFSAHFSVKNAVKGWQNVYESLLRCKKMKKRLD